MRAVDLGVLTVKELLARANVDPASGVVDEVIFGQVLQAGADESLDALIESLGKVHQLFG